MNGPFRGSGESIPLVMQGAAVACTLTATDEALLTYTLPANMMGPYGMLEILPVWSMTSSANNKVLKINFGAFVVYSTTRTTSNYERPASFVMNRGATNSQVSPGNGSGSTYVVSTGGPVQTGAIDTTAPVIITVTGNRANGADSLALECCLIRLFRP